MSGICPPPAGAAAKGAAIPPTAEPAPATALPTAEAAPPNHPQIGIFLIQPQRSLIFWIALLTHPISCLTILMIVRTTLMIGRNGPTRNCMTIQLFLIQVTAVLIRLQVLVIQPQIVFQCFAIKSEKAMIIPRPGIKAIMMMDASFQCFHIHFPVLLTRLWNHFHLK